MIQYYTNYINNLKQNKMKVTTIKLKNVYDKEQLYLKIENENGTVIINVGQKTWDAVNKLSEKPPLQKIKPQL